MRPPLSFTLLLDDEALRSTLGARLTMAGHAVSTGGVINRARLSPGGVINRARLSPGVLVADAKVVRELPGLTTAASSPLPDEGLVAVDLRGVPPFSAIALGERTGSTRRMIGDIRAWLGMDR